MAEQKTYIIRVESAVANTYGLGEQVAPNCFFFKDGHYGLSKEELDIAIKATGK
jgi:hypothetical protein